MKQTRNALALMVFGLFSVVGCVPAQQSGSQLKMTLEKLDEASAHFTSAQASFHKVFYTAILKQETDEQDGSIYFIREKAGATQVGLATTGKDARTVEVKNGTIRVYNPGTNCYDSVSKPGIETYLTLGFGGSGKDLSKAWEINDLGSDTMDGVKVEKLELMPKDSSVKANVSKITLWIDLARGVSLKQILLSPSNDIQTATYHDIRVNPAKIDTKAYAIKGKPCGK